MSIEPYVFNVSQNDPQEELVEEFSDMSTNIAMTEQEIAQFFVKHFINQSPETKDIILQEFFNARYVKLGLSPEEGLVKGLATRINTMNESYLIPRILAAFVQNLNVEGRRVLMEEMKVFFPDKSQAEGGLLMQEIRPLFPKNKEQTVLEETSPPSSPLCQDTDTEDLGTLLAGIEEEESPRDQPIAEASKTVKTESKRKNKFFCFF